MKPMIQIPLARDDKYNSQCNGGSERVRASWPTSGGERNSRLSREGFEGSEGSDSEPFRVFGVSWAPPIAGVGGWGDSLKNERC